MTRLRDGSPEFVTWWEAHHVRRSMAGVKIFYYPDRPGREPLRFEYATFQANDDPALKLALYTPAQTGAVGRYDCRAPNIDAIG